MQSDDQPDGGRRPKATIEGSAREVSAQVSEAADDQAPSSVESTEVSSSPAVRSIIITAVIAAGCAVVAVFAVMAALRFGSDPTAQAWRVMTGAEAPRLDVAVLEERSEALRARLATLENAEKQLAELGSRVDAIETAAAIGAQQAREARASNLARIDALEDRFRTLDAATLAATTGVEDLRQEIAAAARTGVSAAAVATRLTRESERIDALESRIGGLEQNVSAAAGDAARALIAEDRLTSKLETLETAAESGIASRLEALEAEAGRLDTLVQTLSIPAILAAHDALLAKARAGGRFDREIAALNAQLGDEPTLQPLIELAARPVPTPAMLADELTRLAQAGDEPPPPAPGTPAEAPGLVGRLIERASEVVQIRRVGGPINASLSRARDLLERGDITAAAATVATLPQSDVRDAWLENARARAELDRALADLGIALDARVASSRSSTNG